MNKITRYSEGIYLMVDECRIAYAQGKKLTVERNARTSLTFNFTQASMADAVARRINEDIEVHRARNLASQVIDPPGEHLS